MYKIYNIFCTYYVKNIYIMVNLKYNYFLVRLLAPYITQTFFSLYKCLYFDLWVIFIRAMFDTSTVTRSHH